MKKRRRASSNTFDGGLVATLLTACWLVAYRLSRLFSDDMSLCEISGTFSSMRKGWGEVQNDFASTFAELVDNYMSSDADVDIHMTNIRNTNVLVVQGESTVVDVNTMFCLGQPKEEHGGIYNEKGHGLKVFQATTGADVMTLVRKLIPNSSIPEYEYYILRYGPRHDLIGINDEAPIIKTTRAKVNVDSYQVLDAVNPVERMAVSHVLSIDHPFSNPAQSDKENLQTTIDLFKQFPTCAKGDYVMFLYYGFNEHHKYMGHRKPPTLSISKQGKNICDILLNDTDRMTTIMSEMYAHSLLSNSIHVERIKVKDTEHVNYSMGDWQVFTVDDFTFKMRASVHKDFHERTSKFGVQDKQEGSGTWLYYNARLVNRDPSFFNNLYDSEMQKNVMDFVSFPVLRSHLVGGGKTTDYIKKEMKNFACHIGCAVEDLPFNADLFETIYTSCGDIVKVKRAAPYFLLGFMTRFEISSDSIIFDVSKENLLLDTRNGCELWKFLRAVRKQQVMWCLKNIGIMNSAIKTSCVEFSTIEYIADIDDDDEEKVPCDTSYSTSLVLNQDSPSSSSRSRVTKQPDRMTISNFKQFDDPRKNHKNKRNVVGRKSLEKAIKKFKRTHNVNTLLNDLNAAMYK